MWHTGTQQLVVGAANGQNWKRKSILKIWPVLAHKLKILYPFSKTNPKFSVWYITFQQKLKINLQRLENSLIKWIFSPLNCFCQSSVVISSAVMFSRLFLAGANLPAEQVLMQKTVLVVILFIIFPVCLWQPSDVWLV